MSRDVSCLKHRMEQDTGEELVKDKKYNINNESKSKKKYTPHAQRRLQVAGRLKDPEVLYGCFLKFKKKLRL